MTSPPSTPPAELPRSGSSDRFVDTGAPCEWAEEYRPGGFHPVNLGDTFRDSKYKVLRKLGYGSSSTVWLAISTGIPKYVALKIMTAKASSTNKELSFLDHLSKQGHGDPGAQHLTVLLDTFSHHGPNGTHLCFVFEPMATTATDLVEELPENQPLINGVVHSEFHPGNLLFSMEDISSVSEDKLRQDEASTAIPLHRVDGKTDRWAPTNLYLRQSLHEHVQLGPELCVKLSDLGGAFWLADPPSDAHTPIALRAPELILHQPFGCGIDIWSFGCLIYEFLTGEVLFAVSNYLYGLDQDGGDDEHFLQLNDIIGPLPDSVMAAWPRSTKWYGPNRQPLNPHDEDEPYIYESLENMFAANKPADIDDTESGIVCKLIRQILDFDPAKRPSAADLLKHPWFSE